MHRSRLNTPARRRVRVETEVRARVGGILQRRLFEEAAPR